MTKASPPRFLDQAIAVALGALAFALYARTAAPSVATVFDDSLELQVVTYTLGIAHPTGYPLYTLLGWLVTRAPWGEPAFRVNLLSGIFAAVAVSAVYGLCRQLWCHRLAAITGAVALALSPVFWSQATIAEVYTLHAAFLAVVLWAALRTGAVQEDVGQAWRRARLLALVYGLSLAHHRMSWLLAPVLVAYLWRVFGRSLSPRRWLTLGLLAASPLLLYLYIPFRGLSTTSLDGSYENTPVGFLRHVMASAYGVFLSGDPLGVQAQGVGDHLHLFLAQFGPLGLALALLGLVFLLGRRGQRLLLGAALLLNVGFALTYRVADFEVFFIPTFVVTAALIALGLDFVIKVLLGVSRRAGRGWAASAYGLALLSLLAMVAPLPGRWAEQDRSRAWAVHDMGQDWLLSAAPQGAVVGILGEMTLLRYFQAAHGLRPDVALYPADDEQARLRTVEWLVSQGRPTYITRSLPGVAGRFALDAEGALVRVSPRGQETLAIGPGEPVIPGLNLLGRSLEAGETHGRAFVAIGLEWLATQRFERSYKVSARLLRDGKVVASLDAEPVHNTYPTTDWQPVGDPPLEIVQDYYRLELPTGDPGGPVEVLAIVYDAASVSEVARLALGAVDVP